jgi:hypothetical protein
VSKLHKKARNALIAKAALSVARDHLTPPKPKKRRGRKLLFGGLIAGAVAAVVLKRDKVLALLPGKSEAEYVPPPPAPPAPSNYDVSGPVSNTATPVPAPDPVETPAIDEAAEVAAAEAEAANIGGPAPDYAAAAEPGQLAPEEEVPVAEAGEGESEGAERTVRESLGDAENPEPAEALVEDRGEEPSAESAEEPPPETPADPAAPGERAPDDQPSEWRTWSGRSVNP